MIDAKLLEILACPVCQGSVKILTMPDGQSKIQCVECGRKYPVKNGIPVLIADQSEQ